jgi:hypothetical protein
MENAVQILTLHALLKNLADYRTNTPRKMVVQIRVFYYQKKRQWRGRLIGNLGYNFLLRINTKLHVKSLQNSFSNALIKILIDD